VKNIILVLGNKNSQALNYFFETLVTHKNIQKTKIESYDKLDKMFLAQKTRHDYLKNPKYFCEKLEYNYQLSFEPFLKHFFFFFIIDKPKNIIQNEKDINYYELRLRRIYELIFKTKNKLIYFDNQVYKKETYDACAKFLTLNKNFKIKTVA